MRSFPLRLLASLAAVASLGEPARAWADDERADEASLAKEAQLAPLLRLALARNPDLLEEEALVGARVARIAPAARLPDLELKAEAWGVPLGRPVAFDDADTLMIGLRQTLPAPGSRAAKQRVARRDADVARAELQTRRLDLVRQVEDAYLAYALSDRERSLHLEQLELTERTLELSRSAFRAGSASEQDVLRVGVALHRLHRDLEGIEQRRRSAMALLAALTGRAPTAPLGPAPVLAATEIRLDRAALEALAAAHRPEMRAAQSRTARGKAEVAGARAEARWPSFMVGVDYWNMPNAEEPHAYGAMVSINLPWLNPRHQEEVTAAERANVADQRALAAVATTIRYEVDDAFARYEAARATHLVTRGDLLPAARQSFEAAQAGFAAGKGNALALLEALQSLLEVRMDEVREVVTLRASIADLERAVGTELEETALAPTQGVQP